MIHLRLQMVHFSTTPNKVLEVRGRELVFDFGDDGQMTAKGVTRYPSKDVFLQNNKPTIIPVTGGSLSFFGATGQVASEKLSPAGDHSHTFQIYVYKAIQQKNSKTPFNK